MNSLRQRVQKANSARVDLYISIHVNAFNGMANGTEVYAINEAGRRIAQPVLENILALGFAQRGVKDVSHLYVLENTSMPGILIECCFIDSEKDIKLFKEYNCQLSTIVDVQNSSYCYYGVPRCGENNSRSPSLTKQPRAANCRSRQ